MEKKKNKIAQELGRLGGLATKKKYGNNHYANLGKKRMQQTNVNRTPEGKSVDQVTSKE